MFHGNRGLHTHRKIPPRASYIFASEGTLEYSPDVTPVNPPANFEALNVSTLTQLLTDEIHVLTLIEELATEAVPECIA